MAGEYVPMAQRTPEQQEAYRAGCRERNRRYYARKRNRHAEIRVQAATDAPIVVACSGCGGETIPICGFCNAGLR